MTKSTIINIEELLDKIKTEIKLNLIDKDKNIILAVNSIDYLIHKLQKENHELFLEFINS